MVAGPAQLEQLQQQVRALAESVEALHRNQDAALAEVRRTVNAAVDDLAARRAALGELDDDGRT